ncbi:N-acetylglucosamine-6-phosphate deacetylase [Novosphingopyxis sp.]|uniref:N-acetylglucosamine-6-phosphate deacetylase n=1 Tax=Novosphingopyxis sp. TaxID=2709690 RepID=UPI003B59ECCF
MTHALTGGRILLESGMVQGHALLIDNGQIAAIVGARDVPVGTPCTDLGEATLLPGFIDCQVNGGGGVLFNENPTVEAIAAIGAAHRNYGTTGFLPTLLTDSFDVVRAGMAAVGEAIAQGVPGVLGIHIEGPFLSADRGGIHDPDKMRPLDEDGFALVTGMKRGVTLLTLAPERTSPAMIRRLTAAGIIVAAGHTNGTYAQIRSGLDAGVRGFTHLFNAMSPLTSRAPGAVGAALEDDESWCGLIVDGHHVDPVTMRLALRLKRRERIMLVTDAMPSVGAADKDFSLQGRPVTVRGGVCRDEFGTLAGSDLDMASAVRNAVRLLELPLEAASMMASASPAEFLGIAPLHGRIAVGARADLVAMAENMTVQASWIGGEGSGAVPAAPAVSST